MKFFKFFALYLVAQFASLSTVLAVDIQSIVSPKGINAYLVENHNNPIVTISFSFAGGATQDLDNKEGSSRLLSSMLDEGAGSMNGVEFQAKTEELGMDLRFVSGSDNFSGSMQTLKTNADEAFELLRLAVNEPRFDPEPLERMRVGIIKRLKRARTSHNAIAGKALREMVFKGHPYARSSRGTVESVSKLSKHDIANFHKNIFVKKGLVIGAVGAITPKQLGKYVDAVFGDLPDEGAVREIDNAAPNFGNVFKRDMDISQSVLAYALPGYKRNDPDFFAAYIVNHILGGGSFSSRLYDEVREKRGLAYSISSSLAALDHGAYLAISSATRSDRIDETISLIEQEFEKMANAGPSAEELASAKKYIVGSYAIRNLDTSSKIASVLVAIQQNNLGIDYIDRRADLINSVTLEDTKRVAKKMLSTKPTMVIVGPGTS